MFFCSTNSLIQEPTSLGKTELRLSRQEELALVPDVNVAAVFKVSAAPLIPYR